mmetsp:Transcript_13509/g.28528  ORF Transcript_13509/g.28528 Transcript_13509/m.28528 type:complete len:89 (-) Transcript_13509:49-315(-)
MDFHPDGEMDTVDPFGSNRSFSNMAMDDDGLDEDKAIAVANPPGPPPTMAQSTHRCESPAMFFRLNAEEWQGVILTDPSSNPSSRILK